MTTGAEFAAGCTITWMMYANSGSPLASVIVWYRFGESHWLRNDAKLKQPLTPL